MVYSDYILPADDRAQIAVAYNFSQLLFLIHNDRERRF